jgi:hypothetical protein
VEQKKTEIFNGVIVPGKTLDIDGWKRSIVAEHSGPDGHGKIRAVEFEDMNNDRGEYDFTEYTVYEMAEVQS